jgi:hypothetical protein
MEWYSHSAAHGSTDETLPSGSRSRLSSDSSPSSRLTGSNRQSSRISLQEGRQLMHMNNDNLVFYIPDPSNLRTAEEASRVVLRSIGMNNGNLTYYIVTPEEYHELGPPPWTIPYPSMNNGNICIVTPTSLGRMRASSFSIFRGMSMNNGSIYFETR